jgi:ABC-type transporter Mla subunit MlaD
MKRILLSGSILLAIGAFIFFSTGAANPPSKTVSYKIELDNAFGLTQGGDFKVTGVRAGTISNIGLDQKTLNALITVTVNQPGLQQFRQSASCDTEPQSLIGEYFLNCEPGSTGPVLKNGATIPVTHTHTTIPADLLLDINRLPVRQRLALLINGLGAGVAGRSGDLQAALDRAVPALRETDQLLNLLANDSGTINSLNVSANRVVTALANNTGAITRFIQYARNAAADTATQQVAFGQTWHDLPGFLAQLRPTLKQLGQASDANLPVLQNLHAAAAQLDRLFVDLPGFAGASKPALKALGQASVTGKVALNAARPTIAQLNTFATHTPELAGNLAVVLPHIDNRKYATEPNPRSPGGKGYTGLEALLQYVFNQAASINYYGPYGHMLAVDGFLNQMCSPYATPSTIAAGLKQYGAAYRSCYAFLGPNQPGVNETDPSNPGACVPDPGAAPGGASAAVYDVRGPSTTAAKCPAAASDASTARTARRGHRAAKGSRSSAPASTGAPGASGPPSTPLPSAVSKVASTISSVLSMIGGSTTTSKAGSAVGRVGHVATTATGSSTPSSSSQTERLLNYLLAP